MKNIKYCGFCKYYRPSSKGKCGSCGFGSRRRIPVRGAFCSEDSCYMFYCCPLTTGRIGPREWCECGIQYIRELDDNVWHSSTCSNFQIADSKQIKDYLDYLWYPIEVIRFFKLSEQKGVQ